MSCTSSCSDGRRHRCSWCCCSASAQDRLPLACCVGQFLGLVFIYGMETSAVFEPRYLYESAPVMIILTAEWLRKAPDMLMRRYPAASIDCYRGACAMLVVILCALSFPYRISWLYGQYKNNFWEGNVTYVNWVMDHVQKPAIIFLPNYREFLMLFYLKPPRDNSPVIVARWSDHRNPELMNFYPGRHAYVVKGTHIEELPQP